MKTTDYHLSHKKICIYPPLLSQTLEEHDDVHLLFVDSDCYGRCFTSCHVVLWQYLRTCWNSMTFWDSCALIEPWITCPHNRLIDVGAVGYVPHRSLPLDGWFVSRESIEERCSPRNLQGLMLRIKQYGNHDIMMVYIYIYSAKTRSSAIRLVELV